MFDASEDSLGYLNANSVLNKVIATNGLIQPFIKDLGGGRLARDRQDATRMLSGLINNDVQVTGLTRSQTFILRLYEFLRGLPDQRLAYETLRFCFNSRCTSKRVFGHLRTMVIREARRGNQSEFRGSFTRSFPIPGGPIDFLYVRKTAYYQVNPKDEYIAYEFRDNAAGINDAVARLAYCQRRCDEVYLVTTPLAVVGFTKELSMGAIDPFCLSGRLRSAGIGYIIVSNDQQDYKYNRRLQSASRVGDWSGQGRDALREVLRGLPEDLPRAGASKAARR